MGKVVNQDEYLRELTNHFKPLSGPLADREIPGSLKELCIKLRDAFRPINVDLEFVNHLLLTYKSNPADWEDYINFDANVYTRNLVDEGNGKYNLIILCWNTGQQSAIHNHSDCNCFMKMLQGELTEVRFEIEHDESNVDDMKQKLVEMGQKTIKTNDVCYINDHIGLHRVKNPSKTIGAISLHLYCPAFKFCKVYEKTGASKTSEMIFHTKYGQQTIED